MSETFFVIGIPKEYHSSSSCSVSTRANSRPIQRFKLAFSKASKYTCGKATRTAKRFLMALPEILYLALKKGKPAVVIAAKPEEIFIDSKYAFVVR